VRKRRSQQGPKWSSAAARRLLALAGNPPSVEAAIDIVTARLLEGFQCPPTDLEAIRPRLNITQFCAEDIAGSGELQRDGDGLKVVYSSTLSSTRKRFTIAHEMAHALFESTGPNCPRTGVELERLCDKIAAEILMPKRIFLGLLGREFSVKRILELSQLFRTSVSATAIRCAELLKVSVFGVEGDTIIWAFGVVKSGPISRTNSMIRELHAKLNRGEPVDEIICLYSRTGYSEWRAEAMPIGSEDRALFLLTPHQLYRRHSG
jgi:IrrE N-terminal-like domain